MRLIAISAPEYFGGEASIVNELFERGLPLLHVNKPDSSEEEMGVFLQQIRSTFHDRITVHGHYALAQRLGMGGIHLLEPNDLAPAGWHGRLSTTCHAVVEATWRAKMMDYVFLGPVYGPQPDASKPDALTRGRLIEAGANGLLANHIVAVGGVSPERIGDLRNLGFRACAVCSALWRDRSFDAVLDNYAKLVEVLIS